MADQLFIIIFGVLFEVLCAARALHLIFIIWHCLEVDCLVPTLVLSLSDAARMILLSDEHIFAFIEVVSKSVVGLRINLDILVLNTDQILLVNALISFRYNLRRIILERAVDLARREVASHHVFGPLGFGLDCANSLSLLKVSEVHIFVLIHSLVEELYVLVLFIVEHLPISLL